MTLALGMFLKPFLSLLVLIPVYLLSRFIYRRMPDSKLKRFLFLTIPGHEPRRWD